MYFGSVIESILSYVSKRKNQQFDLASVRVSIKVHAMPIAEDHHALRDLAPSNLGYAMK
jgi:hypothetical protein